MEMTPKPPKREYTLTQHGISRLDEYYWMRNRDDPEALKYLQAENDYLDKALSHIKPLQERLFQEMKGRIKEVDSSVPEKNKGYYYYKRFEAGRQYPIFCRRKDSMDAAEEILLDQNELAKGHEFCSVSAFSVSPDGTKLAYSVDLEGAEVYTIYVKDLVSGRMYPDKIERAYGAVYFHTGVEWTNDSQAFYYLTLDENHRADKFLRHRLGTDPKEDSLLFQELDHTFSLSIIKSRSDQFIFLYHYNTTSQEMQFLPADDPNAELNMLQSREPNHEFYAGHHGDFFYLLTNDNAYNFRLVRTPTASPGRNTWQEIVPEREDILLEDMDMFEHHIVLQEHKNGIKQLEIFDTHDFQNAHHIQFPEQSYAVSVEDNPEFHTNIVRFKYSSLITPNSIVDYNMDSREWTVQKEDDIPNYDKSQYETTLLFAAAPDGKRIPITIAHKKDLNQNGRNPTLLYGYGAYGSPSEPFFNSAMISLLERGFIYAVAHVRGGGEMGRAWYDEGRLLNKKNSFTDLISCAEYLIEHGFTSSEKLAVIGGSAGGLLVGASMVMRPDLFKAVICKVPFLDVVTTMSDPGIPLTALEYDQWGNPANKDEFDYMLSYSPYDNIKPVEYPHLLLTTGFNDPRVAYWEPAKFLARLRDIKTGDNLAVMQTNFSAGHAGASGRYDYQKENALDFAFLIDKLTEMGG